jgi:uncharacterized protein (UPF0332 family)
MTADNNDLEIIKMMLKKGRKKLKSAVINFENECFDDSVSRAYYAVFHTISAVLMTKTITCSSHKETIGLFNKEFIKPGIFPKSFTKTIQKLFNERQTGDYDFGSSIGADIAKEDIKQVKEIIDTCETYLAEFYKVPREYWKE